DDRRLRPLPAGEDADPDLSDGGARLGTAHLCVLTISKLDLPHWGVRRIVQTVREADSLPFASVVSVQRQTFLFARDQRHTTAIFEGRVVGRSGRSLTAAAPSPAAAPVDGKANWLVTLRLS